MKTVTKNIDINAHITNIQYQIVSEEKVAKAIVSFDNLGFGVVSAVKLNAKGFNSFGDKVLIDGKEEFVLIIQDLHVEKNASVEGLEVELPNNDIRILNLDESQICYSEGFVLNYKGPDNRVFNIEQFETDGAEKEALDAIRNSICSKARSYPQECNDGWICSCERYNTQELNTCSNCGVDKTEIFKVVDPAYVADLVSSHKRNEADRLERARKEEVAKNKAAKGKTIKLAVGIIAVLVVALFVGHAVLMSSRTTYSSEEEMRSALQGSYYHYDTVGNPNIQIVISGNEATYKWVGEGTSDDIHSDIEWNYKNGKIHTFEDLIVTKDGDLKRKNMTFEKGY